MFLEAGSFAQYSIKSGKIIYQKQKFFTKTHLHIKNDKVIENVRERPYYVSDEIVYYWDDYGNVAFEIDYKLTDSFGKKLAKKQKNYEKLWKDNYKYYYKLSKHKVIKDPWYVKKECLNVENLFKITGWLKVLYPQAKEISKENIAGKEAIKYYIDSFSDIYLWNGVVLKDSSYTTTPKDKRIEVDTIKVAVKVDTKNSIPKSIFEPKWLK